MIEIEENSAPNQQIHEQDILKLERFLERSLPLTYKQFLLEKNGGRPKNRAVNFLNRNVLIDRFFSISKKIEDDSFFDYDIYRNLELADDAVGLNRVPIAASMTGDLFCLDYNKYAEYNGDVRIVYWTHDCPGEPDEFVELAPNFESFLSMLQQ